MTEAEALEAALHEQLEQQTDALSEIQEALLTQPGEPELQEVLGLLSQHTSFWPQGCRNNEKRRQSHHQYPPCRWNFSSKRPFWRLRAHFWS